MDHKMSSRISLVLYIISLVLFFIADLAKASWPIAVAIGLLILAKLLQLVFYKCPECGGSLRMKRGRAEYCPHCGEYLDW